MRTKKKLKTLKIRFAQNKVRSVIICWVLSMLMFVGCGKDVSVLKNETVNEIVNETVDKISPNPSVDEEATPEKNNSPKPLIYVDLAGAVQCPGVYQLEEGSRVFEAVALAGGFTEDAYLRNINQAELVMDGQKIYVYTMEEAKELLEQPENNAELSGNSDLTNKVNINLADKSALMTLTGIGATRADAILQYRASHGKFKKIEDLMLVEGIKEKTYDKIKDCITVQ